VGTQVFISYNRSSFAYARLLHDRLEARLHCKVFMDLTSIAPGDNFVKAVEEAENSSAVVAVLVSREWLTTDPVRGRRPVDDEANWMRREVAVALEKRTRVIPVLLGDVSMPSAADLPNDISALAYCQAVVIRDSEFDHDFERFILLLEGEVSGDLVGRTEALRPSRFVADLVYYFPRFLKLIVMPKRVVRAYTANREEELTRAISFLLISLVIYTTLSMPLFITKDKMVVLLVVQFFMFILLAFASSALLQLSWWLVGGRASFSRYLSVNSYYVGVSIVLGICIMVAAMGVLRAFDPHMLDLLRKAAVGDIFPLIEAHPARSAPLRMAVWIVGIGNLLLLVWTYGFWGAYREINNLKRFYSLLAFCCVCLIELPVGFLFILMQQGLFNLLR